jgi:hypothetical protein
MKKNKDTEIEINNNNDSNSNINSNDIIKSETSFKNQNLDPIVEQNSNSISFNHALNENIITDEQTINNTNEQSSGSSMSSWILYLIVIGISIYFILQNTDPINIAFTSLGCGVTLFLLHKTLNRKIYKLEDDDDGVNLIEG